MRSQSSKQLSSAGAEEFGEISRKELDDANLARMGKRPILKRNFGLMSMLGFSCTILITWEGIVVLFLQAYQNGGPAGAVYGFLFVWAGVAATFGTNLGGAVPLDIYASAAIVHEIDELPDSWHATLIFWAVVAFSVSINSVGGNVLPRFEGFILILHILGFFAILIPLTYMADHGTPKEVFTKFLNMGEFPSQGLSFFVGMVGCMFAFAGGDAAVHMSEEITNAAVAVPTSIMLSVLINGSLGFGMLIAMLFCSGDLGSSLNSPTGYPFLAIFLEATGSTAATAVMGSIVTTMGATTSVGMLASTSRQFWSFARDRGIPGWRLWSQVTDRSAVPLYSVLVTSVIACLLALINIGSSVAFNDLCSMSISGLYLSYMVVGGLLLWRRCTGGIGFVRGSHSAIINTAGAKLVWGPFHVPGIWGILMNAWALVYMTVAVFFSFWPPAWAVTVQTMNFSVVGTLGTVIASLFYYYARASKVYSGPVMEHGL
ncbi:GABA permease, putative [Penicillium digitatum PHI26]|uniref:GABA permease, putative n=2 Tax=Penicillium digitatum TaxID=36651 RepID=K9G2B4_PEND2|nr:GABA permease, putative [Penicillium digitatum Pd1]EKV10439.1 GABA permease, putative [Penicillium digitatum Pd1]EKV15454.1 GABA permease, putative [Penicillium digitatum PHI26]